jgi:hypothetical protein
MFYIIWVINIRAVLQYQFICVNCSNINCSTIFLKFIVEQMQFEQLTFFQLYIFLLDIAFLHISSSFFNLFNCSNQVKPDWSSQDFSVEQSRFLKKVSSSRDSSRWISSSSPWLSSPIRLIIIVDQLIEPRPFARLIKIFIKKLIN